MARPSRPTAERMVDLPEAFGPKTAATRLVTSLQVRPAPGVCVLSDGLTKERPASVAKHWRLETVKSSNMLTD